jgi:hypothetical protein
MFSSKTAQRPKRIEKSSKGLKKKEWPLLANNEGAARAQFEMIEEKRQRRHQTKLYYSSSAFGCSSSSCY